MIRAEPVFVTADSRIVGLISPCVSTGALSRQTDAAQSCRPRAVAVEVRLTMNRTLAGTGYSRPAPLLTGRFARLRTTPERSERCAVARESCPRLPVDTGSTVYEATDMKGAPWATLGSKSPHTGSQSTRRTGAGTRGDAEQRALAMAGGFGWLLLRLFVWPSKEWRTRRVAWALRWLGRDRD